MEDTRIIIIRLDLMYTSGSWRVLFCESTFLIDLQIVVLLSLYRDLWQLQSKCVFQHGSKILFEIPSKFSEISFHLFFSFFLFFFFFFFFLVRSRKSCSSTCIERAKKNIWLKQSIFNLSLIYQVIQIKTQSKRYIYILPTLLHFAGSPIRFSHECEF